MNIIHCSGTKGILHQQVRCNVVTKQVLKLQITVGHWTIPEQNRPMSNEIITLVGHYP